MVASNSFFSLNIFYLKSVYFIFNGGEEVQDEMINRSYLFGRISYLCGQISTLLGRIKIFSDE